MTREEGKGIGARGDEKSFGFSAARRPSSVSCRGFTLVELTVTLIVLGILAASVAPRFIDRSEFDVYGFFDATASFLRYAQKSAVAQRRTVCVAFGGDSSATLSVAKNSGGACDTPLTGPDGVSPHRLSPPPGIAFAARVDDFSFLPSGEASAGRTIRVAGLPGKSLVVWASTGYVQVE